VKKSIDRAHRELLSGIFGINKTQEQIAGQLICQELLQAKATPRNKRD
jgi:hypothetical protein